MSRRKGQPATFLCRSCGEDYPQWYGRCPNCGEWNSLVSYRPPSERPGPGKKGSKAGRRPRGLGIPGHARQQDSGLSAPWHSGERDPAFEAGVRLLGAIPAEGPQRIKCGLAEFDRVLGGGIVPGSVVLIGGDPGIGKSTLLLQVASRLVEEGRGVLYVSGEESASQTKLRAIRLGVTERLAVLAEADLERVIEAVGEGVAMGEDASARGASVTEDSDDANGVPKVPGDTGTGGAAIEASHGSPVEASHGGRPVDVLFVDSIQSAYLPALPSAPGSVLQVREGALLLTEMAKRRGVAVLLVGHVTKDGSLAGPRTLEHIVDAVLTMEGERFQAHRLLRSMKNRFGSVHEIGVFDMREDGMHEVTNPSMLFLGDGAGRSSGSAVVAGVEGTRSLLVEVQALVHPTRYGIPQRIATGFDNRRLAILLAVLVKRGGIDVTSSDVFVNVAGGLRMDEPGVDLGILLAIASSTLDQPIGQDLAAFGEVGLGGEVRRVSGPERRIAEAARLGFKRIVVPKATSSDLQSQGWKVPAGCAVLTVSTLGEALRCALVMEQDA